MAALGSDYVCVLSAINRPSRVVAIAKISVSFDPVS